MPRFYFDVTTDGVVEIDQDGLDLPSLPSARKEARTAAAEIAKEGEACPKNVEIIVRDGGRERVAAVQLSLVCD
jgi:hypothetical protein